MVNGLLKKLALTGMIGAGIMFGAKDVRAAPVDWSSFSEIVGTIPEGYSQNYTSTTSTFTPEKICGILYFNHPILGDTAIGGFDLQNGNVVLSYFGDVGQKYIANTGEGADPNYIWKVFKDSNRDNILGKRDGSVILDGKEELAKTSYKISGFTSYGSQNPGSFTFTEVPEPSTLTMLALGAAVVGLSRRRRFTDKQVGSKYHK